MFITIIIDNVEEKSFFGLVKFKAIINSESFTESMFIDSIYARCKIDDEYKRHWDNELKKAVGFCLSSIFFGGVE